MKILVVGAGFSGATVARELAEAGHTVDIIDSRDHVGGNAYDYINDYNIRVHKYGPHLFHTNNDRVVNYLSKFTKWVPYRHKVRAQLPLGGSVVFPPNAETKRIVGEENIIDLFYRPYTRKMWGKELEEVSPDILNRVPGRDDDVDEYFPNDKFQALPKEGYTKLIENMLDHPNITIALMLNFEWANNTNYDHIFYSGSIDNFYSYKFGILDYRSIKFHNNIIDCYPEYTCASIACVTLNYTDAGHYTRVTEWKRLPNSPKTSHSYSVVTQEEPCDFKNNSWERYYPIQDDINKERYLQYKNIENPKVTFIGRCGLYVYINMDQAVNSALATVRKFIENNG